MCDHGKNLSASTHREHQIRQSVFLLCGESSVYTVLQAMGIGQGDEVISQVFTCFRVANPIVRLGAARVCVDINPATFRIDPGRLGSNYLRCSPHPFILRGTKGSGKYGGIGQGCARFQRVYRKESSRCPSMPRFGPRRLKGLQRYWHRFDSLQVEPLLIHHYGLTL